MRGISHLGRLARPALLAKTSHHFSSAPRLPAGGAGAKGPGFGVSRDAAPRWLRNKRDPATNSFLEPAVPQTAQTMIGRFFASKPHPKTIGWQRRSLGGSRDGVLFPGRCGDCQNATGIESRVSACLRSGQLAALSDCNGDYCDYSSSSRRKPGAFCEQALSDRRASGLTHASPGTDPVLPAA